VRLSDSLTESSNLVAISVVIKFVTEAIRDRLMVDLIEECENQPYVVNPLTVSASNNSRKKRLILDLRHVNKHLCKTSIKFEDIRMKFSLKCRCF
jgi:hypothetical protein